MPLHEGIYERLITAQLADEIQHAKEQDLHCLQEPIDSAEAASLLADYVAERLRKLLHDEGQPVEEQIALVNALLRQAGVDSGNLLCETPELLSEVLSAQRFAGREVTKRSLPRPLSGFHVSSLFTGGQSEVSLSAELLRDMASADRICIIVSFLRLSGVRLLLDELRRFCSVPGHSLRLITTTYCGVTEAKALEQLSQLPNTEIRISYNTRVERLHAKAYLFLRDSGYSTAYIGSSNLSHSAQTDGLEWNVRATEVENPHILKSALATFERYWESEDFEDFQLGGLEKFKKELRLQHTSPSPGEEAVRYQRYQLLPHQKTILDRLQAVREEGGCYRNLLVAATGTGKTVISAFDYKRYRQAHPEACRLLFVAHREEILRQALYTYRSVLGDPNFGELWVGSYRPEQGLDELFISVATLRNNLELFRTQGLDYYPYLVIDEAHHTAADSYRVLVEEFRPQLLLGLTATPERMDGQSLLPDFGYRVSAEIRLPQALQAGLLTPFQYFCITDSVDLSDEELWSGGRYVTSKLSLRLCDEERLGLIVAKLREYIADEQRCRALCFCTDKQHARFMAEGLSRYGLKAAALTSETSEQQRISLVKDLAAGRINYLCTVDIFNEGVDIPEVDTALFLRPTDSLTIFLQQLGRGLRLSPGKEYLTVLDFVAQANQRYDFTSRFRALCLRQDRSIEEQVRQGFTFLPPGCSIFMERVAREHILENIHQAVYGQRRLIKELRAYTEVPTLSEFIAGNGQDVRLIYRGENCWTTLKQAAGKAPVQEMTPLTRRLTRGMGNLIHINSSAFLHTLRGYARGDAEVFALAPSLSEEEQQRRRHFKLMLYYALFQEKPSKLGYASVDAALAELQQYPLYREEIGELADYLLAQLPFTTKPLGAGLPLGLELHGCYTREEVFTLFDRQTEERRMQGVAAGVFSLEAQNLELLFVTLNKSDKDFSPTTQYDDYFISERLFHWQSQNKMSHANAGRRYVEQAEHGRRYLLFVRPYKADGYGRTSPFYCMGLMRYRSSHGDFPMNITWELDVPALPAFLPEG